MSYREWIDLFQGGLAPLSAWSLLFLVFAGRLLLQRFVTVGSYWCCLNWTSLACWLLATRSHLLFDLQSNQLPSVLLSTICTVPSVLSGLLALQRMFGLYESRCDTVPRSLSHSRQDCCSFSCRSHLWIAPQCLPLKFQNISSWSVVTHHLFYFFGSTAYSATEYATRPASWSSCLWIVGV